MCGIAGIVNLRETAAPPELAPLTRMIGAMTHRGPDESGLYRDATAGLAHTRLSIIDLTTGQQPLSNEDGTLWVVLNGEIFNYIELRRELKELGHAFRTLSDTEVVIHAWEQWGEDALRRFNGQWAFALWDSVRHRLVLSRDRVGIRPLYYARHNDRLIFASEVKAIFAGEPDFPRELDPVGLDETFTFWSIVPPRCVFKGVSELRPGHVRIYDSDQAVESAYWTPSFPQNGNEGFAGTVEEATEAVYQALEEATSLRMLRADVPVASYLSGGLDSSLIAALGLAAKGERFHTFSIRFEDAEYDETDFQQLVANHLGTDHHDVTVTQADIAKTFPDVIQFTERPILRTAPAPLFLLSRLVRESGTKVVLTGEGADEIFAGYDLFREGKVRRFWARRPDSTRRPLLLKRLYPYLARSPVSQQAMSRRFFGRNLGGWQQPGFAHDIRWHSTAALKRLFSPAMRKGAEQHDVVAELLGDVSPEFKNWSYLAQDQYLEMRTLLTGYLLSSQGDRMLMAHSVEGRFPFLDHNVIELSNSLPDSYKLAVLDEKHILKRVSRGLVPTEILKRKKQPYRAPDALCFSGADAPDWVGAVMDETALSDAGVFNPGAARHLWEKCRRRADRGQFSNTDNMALVGVLSTQLLHEQFVRCPPPITEVSHIQTFVDRQKPSGGPRP